jgi:hypothetical protein
MGSDRSGKVGPARPIQQPVIGVTKIEGDWQEYEGMRLAGNRRHCHQE